MAGRTGKRWRRVAAGVVTVLGVTVAAGTMFAKGAHPARVKTKLTATSLAPDARGKTRLLVKSSSKGKFSIVTGGLPGGKTFDVIVGGVKVGALTASSGGSGRASFSTTASAKDALLGFDPRGTQVVLRDEEDGDDVLVGDIPGGDPTAVACCLPESGDDGEVECEDRTPEECSAAGGTVQTAASCLPNPCATTPPGNEALVCCTNATGDDESEAECEDVATEAECSSLGGTIVQATSCDPNPCAATAPSSRTACCVPDDDGGGEIDCEVLSAEACTAQGGMPVGVDSGTAAATCSGDPCGTGTGSGDGDSGGSGGSDD